MERANESEPRPEPAHNGRLTFYHPTGGGTGSAARFELRLNRRGEKGYNCLFLELARQSGPPARSETGRQGARFDWQNKITVKLAFGDLCELLAVLEGRKPSAGGERGGIYHASGGASTIIALKKRDDQPGFLLGLSRKANGDGQAAKVHIVLNEMESFGLGHVLRQTLFRVAFNESLIA